MPPPLVPPLRFAMVEEGIYRGAYPSLINLRFLARLRLKTVISLLPEPPSADLVRWCEEEGIALHAEVVAPFREEVVLSHEKVNALLSRLVALDAGPVYLHCLDGVCVTGTVVLCLRKLQRWAATAAAAEYSRFARDGGDVPHLPPSHVSRFVSAWRPEPRRALPQHLPRWLALHLGDAGGAPSAAQRDHERAGGTAQNGDANPTAESAAGAAAAFSSALQALALEGLTMKPGVHSLHPAVGPAGAHPIGVLGESDMHK